MSFRLAMSLKINKEKKPSSFGRFSYLLMSSESFKSGEEGEMLKCYDHINDATTLEHYTKKMNKYFFKKINSKKQYNVEVNEILYYELRGKMIYFETQFENVRIENRENLYNVIVNLDKDQFHLLNDVSYKTVNSAMFLS